MGTLPLNRQKTHPRTPEPAPSQPHPPEPERRQMCRQGTKPDRPRHLLPVQSDPLGVHRGKAAESIAVRRAPSARPTALDQTAGENTGKWVRMIGLFRALIASILAVESGARCTRDRTGDVFEGLHPSTIGPVAFRRSPSRSPTERDRANRTRLHGRASDSPALSLSRTDRVNDMSRRHANGPVGGGTITYADGTLGGGQSCTVTVPVTASTPGIHKSGDHADIKFRQLDDLARRPLRGRLFRASESRYPPRSHLAASRP